MLMHLLPAANSWKMNYKATVTLYHTNSTTSCCMPYSVVMGQTGLLHVVTLLKFMHTTV